MPDLRHKLWLNILEDLGPPEGCILPAYLICVYVALFPLLGWRALLDKALGFDILQMTWTIHGLRISDCMLMQLATAQDRVYRVTSVNGVATLEDLTDGWASYVPQQEVDRD